MRPSSPRSTLGILGFASTLFFNILIARSNGGSFLPHTSTGGPGSHASTTDLRPHHRTFQTRSTSGPRICFSLLFLAAHTQRRTTHDVATIPRRSCVTYALPLPRCHRSAPTHGHHRETPDPGTRAHEAKVIRSELYLLDHIHPTSHTPHDESHFVLRLDIWFVMP